MIDPQRSKRTDYPRCKRFECANNVHDHCVALNTAIFKDDKCPFYITRGEARQKAIDAERRLAEIGAKKKSEAHKNEQTEKA